MRIARIIQFLLLALILLGVFASMARNSYGFTLMGVACFGLAVLYLVQLGWKAMDDVRALGTKEFPGMLELLGLSVLSAIAGMRIFYFHVPYVDVVIGAEGLLLLSAYLLIARDYYVKSIVYSLPLARIWLSFFGYVVLFILAGLTGLLKPEWSAYVGGFGVVLSLPFLVSALRNRRYEYAGKSNTVIELLISSEYKAGLLSLVFAGVAFYSVLSGFSLIPKVSDLDQPGVYLELINQAETRQEKPVNGKFKHESYRAAMDKFLKRHGSY